MNCVCGMIVLPPLIPLSLPPNFLRLAVKQMGFVLAGLCVPPCAELGRFESFNLLIPVESPRLLTLLCGSSSAFSVSVMSRHLLVGERAIGRQGRVEERIPQPSSLPFPQANPTPGPRSGPGEIGDGAGILSNHCSGPVCWSGSTNPNYLSHLVIPTGQINYSPPSQHNPPSIEGGARRIDNKGSYK